LSASGGRCVDACDHTARPACARAQKALGFLRMLVAEAVDAVYYATECCIAGDGGGVSVRVGVLISVRGPSPTEVADEARSA